MHILIGFRSDYDWLEDELPYNGRNVLLLSKDALFQKFKTVLKQSGLSSAQAVASMLMEDRDDTARSSEHIAITYQRRSLCVIIQYNRVT